MGNIIFVLLALLSASVFADDDNQERSVITIGILNGGGGLIGVDYEIMPFDGPIGLQAGVGILSLGGGINIHFDRTPKSSMVSLRYWDQNFIVSDYRQSILGLTWVYRSSIGFTAEIGAGTPLTIGPKVKSSIYKNNIPPAIYMYSIGWYFSM